MSLPSKGHKELPILPQLKDARRKRDLSGSELPDRTSLFLTSWKFHDRPLQGLAEYNFEEIGQTVPRKCASYRQHPIGGERGNLKSQLLAFGRALDGASVCINVIGFMPWAVIEWPEAWNRASDLNAFRLHLQRTLLNDRGTEDGEEDLSPMIQVKTTTRQPLMGYQEAPNNVLVVYFATEWMRRSFRFKCDSTAYRGHRIRVHESEVDPATQFLIASGINSMQWFSVPTNRLEPPSIWLTHCEREYQLQLNDQTRQEPLGHYFQPRTDLQSLGQLTVLSFDTEFKGTGTHFPQPGVPEDECFAICASVSLLGSDTILHRAAFTFGMHGERDEEAAEAELPETFKRALKELKETNTDSERYPLARPNVLYNEASQIEMFRAFRKYVLEVDPDIITGYNIEGFDCKRMDAMVQALNKRSGQTDSCTANYLSRMVDEPCKVVSKEFDNAGAGQNDRGVWDMTSRTMFDPYFWLKTNVRLKKYSLEEVSQFFLKISKVHVAYTEINQWRESRDALLQTKGLIYCARDADLPIYLLEKLQMITTQIMLGQLTSTSLQKVVSCGQQARIYNQINVAAYRHPITIGGIQYRYYNNVVPAGREAPKRKFSDMEGGGHADVDLDNASDGEEEDEEGEDDIDRQAGGAGDAVSLPGKYQGATVFEPVTGKHRWVGCLDFQSLYPSIMRAHNICPSTLVMNPQEHPPDVPVNTARISATVEHLFVKSHVRRGLTPEILRHLLEKRDEVKQKLKAAKKDPNSDPQTVANYDAKQNACKLAANSIYGFYGAIVGRMYMPQVAASVTYFGREGIQITKRIVEESTHGGPGIRKQVVYGDTDSVFIKILCPDIEAKGPECKVEILTQLIELMQEMAKEVTKHFRDNGYADVKLVFEKIFSTLLLIQKKKYLGEACEGTTPDTWKVMIKGLKAVRRDVPPFINHTYDQTYHEIAVGAPQEKALQVVMDTLAQLAENRLPTSQYETSRSLKRTYKSTLPGHALLNQKKAAREPGTEGRPGDRIDFVIVTGKGLPQKVSERLEDPAYFEKHRDKLAIDRVHYLKLFKPEILQVFDCLKLDLRPVMATCHAMLVNQQNRQYSILGLFATPPPPSPSSSSSSITPAATVQGQQSAETQALWKSFAASGLHKVPLASNPVTTTPAAVAQKAGAITGLFGQRDQPPSKKPVPPPKKTSAQKPKPRYQPPASPSAGGGIMSMFKRPRLPGDS